jgi:nicotinamide-nucleotide amidase
LGLLKQHLVNLTQINIYPSFDKIIYKDALFLTNNKRFRHQIKACNLAHATIPFKSLCHLQNRCCFDLLYHSGFKICSGNAVMTNVKYLSSISSLLLEKEETVAIAESVTAGLITATFSLAKDATQFLQGGITAYNLGQKTRQLNIEPIHAEKMNCVSGLISQQMAHAVAKKFCSRWGIGITGYAVPVPALKIRTCFAIYSFVYDGKIILTERIETKKKGQANVQRYFTEKVIQSLETQLKTLA